MTGREFLEVARQNLAGTAEPFWRAAVNRSYYALFLECRNALRRWGITPPSTFQAHFFVRSRLTHQGFLPLRTVGNALERLFRQRGQADYDLTNPMFATPARAQQDYQNAVTALAQFDAIDADPQQRAAAIQAIRTAWP